MPGREITRPPSYIRPTTPAQRDSTKRAASAPGSFGQQRNQTPGTSRDRRADRRSATATPAHCSQPQLFEEYPDLHRHTRNRRYRALCEFGWQALSQPIVVVAPRFRGSIRLAGHLEGRPRYRPSGLAAARPVPTQRAVPGHRWATAATVPPASTGRLLAMPARAGVVFLIGVSTARRSRGFVEQIHLSLMCSVSATLGRYNDRTL